MFERFKPSGEWVNIEVVDSDFFEQMDENMSFAIDGKAGGSYDPSARISIGGAGFEVTTAFSFTGPQPAEFTRLIASTPGLAIGQGGVLIGVGAPGLAISEGGMQVVGASVFNDVVSFNDDMTTNGGVIANGGIIGQFGAFGDISANGVMGGNGHGFFSGNLTTNGNLQVGGTSQFTGLVGFTGDVAAQFDGYTLFSKPLVLGGTARVRKRIGVATQTGPASSETFKVSQYDMVMVGGDGALSAGGHEWRVSDEDANDGDEMVFSRELDNGATSINLIRDVDGSLISLLGVNENRWARIVRQAGSWKLFSRQGVLIRDEFL